MQSFAINLIRAYDVAHEIDLLKARQLLVKKNPDKFKISRYSKELTIQDPPLILLLDTERWDFDERSFEVEVSAKIWAYGVISLTFRAQVESVNVDDLTDLVFLLEEDPQLDSRGDKYIRSLTADLMGSITSLNIWEEFEDYTIIQFESEHGPKDLPESFSQNRLARLLEGEKNITFSQQTLDQIKAQTFQYSDEDLIIIDWNRCIVLGDAQEVRELSWIVEYALGQLLELRYYDHLLDLKLMSLYRDIQTKKNGFWRNPYARVAHEAARYFIEISDVMEQLENSLKVIGDTYYAKIYRAALDRFHISSWRNTLNSKLKNLSHISSLFSSDVNERRTQLMELVIIILIAIEVVPFVYQLLSHYN